MAATPVMIATQPIVAVEKLFVVMDSPYVQFQKGLDRIFRLPANPEQKEQYGLQKSTFLAPSKE
jgi:hypothetical protein